MMVYNYSTLKYGNNSIVRWLVSLWNLYFKLSIRSAITRRIDIFTGSLFLRSDILIDLTISNVTSLTSGLVCTTGLELTSLDIIDEVTVVLNVLACNSTIECKGVTKDSIVLDKLRCLRNKLFRVILKLIKHRRLNSLKNSNNILKIFRNIII